MSVHIGSWVDCNPSFSHKGVSVKFFKRPGYLHDFCDLCLYEIQKRNGTLPLSNTFYRHKSPDSKPEKDTL